MAASRSRSEATSLSRRHNRGHGTRRLPRGAAAVILLALLVMPCAQPAWSGEAIRHIISINLCTDQLLMLLVPPERIAAVSFLADDPEVSALARNAAALPKVHSEAEEVLARNPDLVLDGAFAIRPTVSLLRRLGVRVEQIPMSFGIDGIRDNVRMVGRVTQSEAAANRLIAAFDHRLAALPPETPGGRPTAIMYFIGSYVAGSDTLEDAVLNRAGFRNLAAEHGLVGLTAMPLETLLADPPDLIVLGIGAEGYRTSVADNLRHPAFKALLAHVPSLRIDPALMVCDTPRIMDAIEQLAQARIQLKSKQPGPP